MDDAMRCYAPSCSGTIIGREVPAKPNYNKNNVIFSWEPHANFLDQFYWCYYDVYTCSHKHHSMLCKKCGLYIDRNSLRMHIDKCWGGYIHQYNTYDECVSHTSDNHLLIVLRYSGLDNIMCVPAKIPDNSFSIIANKYDNLGVGPKVARMRKRGSECFDEILDFILDQHAYCPLCDMYFDSYPAKEVLISHLNKCEYRKWTISVHSINLPYESTK